MTEAAQADPAYLARPLAGKVAVVTGAGRGIGAAIVHRFVAAGASVAALDREEPGIAALAAALGAAVQPLTVDVAEPDAVEAAIGAVALRHGRIDVLVNNAAAVTPLGTVTEIDLADWRRAIDVALSGAMLVSRACLPHMPRGGAIVHVASQLGSVGSPGRAAYCSAKGGLIQLAKVMALDHAADGIRVNSLSPGPTWTERLEAFWPDRAAAERDAGAAVPLGRLGDVDEIAEAALFLATDAARFVTGTDLVVDGGYLAR